MDDMIYCVNADCPYKDCSRSILTLKDYPDKRKMANTANLGGICRRYVYWVASKAEAKCGKD